MSITTHQVTGVRTAVQNAELRPEEVLPLEGDKNPTPQPLQGTVEYTPQPLPSIPAVEVLAARPLIETDTRIFSVGKNVQGYEIIESIGKGGMAEVFKVEKDGQLYAMKVLNRWMDEKQRGRFRDEARAMTRLNGHPNILSIIDHGVQDSRPYIIGEFAEGKTLHEKIKDIPPEQLLQVMIQLCEGLEHAHQNGYIHRDLKPDNILFSKGIPKLGDFGIARLVDPTDTRSYNTSDGVVIGTLAYMSPEEADQALNAKNDFQPTIQFDLYAVGVILYEGLTGKLPIKPIKNGNGINTLATLRRIVQDAPEPICRLNPTINPLLAASVMSLLEKDPYERSRAYDSAEAVVSELKYYLENNLVTIKGKAA